MKLGDKLHGFEVIRISAGGTTITWKCAMCESKVRLHPAAIDDWMRQHQAMHPAPFAWPFPRVLGTDGKPVSLVWRAHERTNAT